MYAVAHNRGAFDELPPLVRALIRDYCRDRSHRQTPTALIMKSFLARNALAWVRLKATLGTAILRVAPHTPQMINLVVREQCCPPPCMPFIWDVPMPKGRPFHHNDIIDPLEVPNGVVVLRSPDSVPLLGGGRLRKGLKFCWTDPPQSIVIVDT